MKASDFSAELRKEIETQLNRGDSQQMVADSLNVSRSSVARIMSDMRTEGTHNASWDVLRDLDAGLHTAGRSDVLGHIEKEQPTGVE